MADGLADQLAGLNLSIELRRPFAEALARDDTRDDQDDKHSKKEANYDDGPHDTRRCTDCLNFTYGSCFIVRGSISAGGTCDYFVDREPPPQDGGTVPDSGNVGPDPHRDIDD